MTRYVMVGLSVLAGAALLEAALIPGIVVGAAAVLAPTYLPKLRRRLQPLFESAAHQPVEPAVAVPTLPDSEAPLPPVPALGIKRAVAKTITFRIIVTTLDFTSNYLVIGELAAAAGLSTFALVAGPLFYFAHETAWNYFGSGGTIVDVPGLPRLRVGAGSEQAGEGGVTISQAVAKTITFRTVATVVDFTANYVVIRDLASAGLLTAFAFVVGPFVYLGHERAWEYYDSRQERTVKPPTPAKLLPAPG